MAADICSSFPFNFWLTIGLELHFGVTYRLNSFTLALNDISGKFLVKYSDVH